MFKIFYAGSNLYLPDDISIGKSTSQQSDSGFNTPTVANTGDYMPTIGNNMPSGDHNSNEEISQQTIGQPAQPAIAASSVILNISDSIPISPVNISGDITPHLMNPQDSGGGDLPKLLNYTDDSVASNQVNMSAETNKTLDIVHIESAHQVI